MTTNPWLKFYPTDWRGDAALRSVSFAARGLWMDMLTLMHEAEPYGHLIVNGRAPAISRLARMLGGGLEEVTQLLDELEEEGVFSRTEDGTIYSRRMVRDYAKAARDKANGGTGGNPNIKRNGSKGVNPPLNPQVNPGDNGGDKAQKLEARVREERKVPTTSGADAPLADPRSVVWAEGLARLIHITGLPTAKARPRLGQLLRDAGDDCPGLLRVLRECPDTGDPQAWLTKAAAALVKRREPQSKLAWMLPKPGPLTIDGELEPMAGRLQ
jgi:hypothetical protein